MRDRAPGEGGSSGRSSHVSATEGVWVTWVGVTNLGASNRSGGSVERLTSRRAPDPGKPSWPRPRKRCGHPEKLAPRETSSGWNGARWIRLVLVDRRDCRRRQPTSLSCESRRRGAGVEARRSGLTRSSSFDEAAVEAGLVLLAREARQRASAAGKRPSRWPKTPR